MLNKLAQKILLATLFCLPLAASAVPLTLNHSDSGWYKSSGYHNSSNENYIAGNTSSNYRNWFVFDLSGITQNIVSAKLRLYSGNVSSSGIYDTFDVSTGINALLAGGSNKTGIFTDLGSGVGYGSRNIAAHEDCTIIDIVLNQAAIAALNSANGLWAIGGTYASSGYAFGYTGYNSHVRQLILDVQPASVPEPGMFALMTIGFAGILGFKRRRNFE